MGDLPNEVIESIFEQLLPDDAMTQEKHLSSFRLTCKLMAALGARYLVRDVCISSTSHISEYR